MLGLKKQVMGRDGRQKLGIPLLKEDLESIVIL